MPTFARGSHRCVRRNPCFFMSRNTASKSADNSGVRVHPPFFFSVPSSSARITAMWPRPIFGSTARVIGGVIAFRNRADRVGAGMMIAHGTNVNPTLPTTLDHRPSLHAKPLFRPDRDHLGLTLAVNTWWSLLLLSGLTVTQRSTSTRASSWNALGHIGNIAPTSAATSKMRNS
jgi:hypothetical protein